MFCRCRAAKKNQKRDAVGLNGATEQLAGGKDVGSPGKLVQVARSHSRGERLVPDTSGPPAASGPGSTGVRNKSSRGMD